MQTISSEPSEAPTLASDKTLGKRYGVDRSTIWRWSSCGILPKPSKLSAKVTRWNIAACDAALARLGAA